MNIAKGELQAFPSSLCCCPWFTGHLYADSAYVCLSSVILFRVLDPLVVTGCEVFSTCLLSISNEHIPPWIHYLPSLRPFLSLPASSCLVCFSSLPYPWSLFLAESFQFLSQVHLEPIDLSSCLNCYRPILKPPPPPGLPPHVCRRSCLASLPEYSRNGGDLLKRQANKTNTKLLNPIRCVSDVRHCVPWTHF